MRGDPVLEQEASEAGFHGSGILVLHRGLESLHCSLGQTVRGRMIGGTGDVSDSILLDEGLEFTTGESSAVVRDNNLRQTMRCEYFGQLGDGVQGRCGGYGNDFQPL